MLEEAIMVTLHKIHVSRVRVPPHRPRPDVHDELVGTFLGQVPPDAPVGSFGNVPHLRRQGEGTFRGDPDRQREGSFGDHDLTDPETAQEPLPDAA
jgi:hypothetical protein